MTHQLYACTRTDGRVLIGEYPSRRACTSALTRERDLQDTLGEGEVVGFECGEARAPPADSVPPTERLEDSAPAMPQQSESITQLAFAIA